MKKSDDFDFKTKTERGINFYDNLEGNDKQRRYNDVNEYN